jgi:hypothetical protein
MSIVRKRIATVLAVFVLALPITADLNAETAQTLEKQAVPAESDLASHGHYVNKDKQIVHST